MSQYNFMGTVQKVFTSFPFPFSNVFVIGHLPAKVGTKAHVLDRLCEERSDVAIQKKPSIQAVCDNSERVFSSRPAKHGCFYLGLGADLSHIFVIPAFNVDVMPVLARPAFVI
jgi:hypothetical protein